ncbi:hypothetical protein R3P38DRAFT_1464714 [Favolaschia claudopus]|uniref:F-box domain-containing protein n=1 Tax=Favolaschia claudopus TaxID=2862362 RepID=A0AAW0DRI3_9AGAR
MSQPSPEVYDELLILPFVDDDPCGEFGGPQGRVRDLTLVNNVAIECWKALRMPQTPNKPAAQDLSLFPQMPIDILLEVLGHLHPLDVRHVARVNKAFRGLLHGSHGEGIWRNAFVGRKPLPVCPTEISGRRWTKLLFGARECDQCGAADTAPDYRLWRRLCTDCMNSNLISSISPHELNSLVVKTYREDGRTSAADSQSGRLWPADANAVAEEYERLKSADAEAAEEFSPNLPAFIEARREAVRVIEERAEEAEAWSDQVHDDSLPMWGKRYRRVVRSVRKRLIEEGHDPRDVEDTDMDAKMTYLENFPRLTSKRWNKARPHILPLVYDARAERLTLERVQLVANRTSAACSAVSHVLRTAPAETWAYIPPQYTVEAMPQLQELIQDPSDTPLPDDDPRLADALLELPAFVAAWREEKQALLASLLPLPSLPAEAECGPSSSSSSSSFTPIPPLPAPLARLKLATSVFTCLGSWVGRMSVTAGRALIGWAGAGAHLRCRSLRNYWERRPHYAAEGAATAAALLRLVDLDPAVTTAKQMDEVCGGELRGCGVQGKTGGPDKRFVCLLCPVEACRGVRGRRAMRWRECVQHFIERSRVGGDVSHPGVPPAFGLLTDEAVDDLRRREAPDPVLEDAAWACALCSAHYDSHSRTTYEGVEEHVRTRHQIEDPEQGTHFLYVAGSERTPRVPALLSQEGNVLELRCNRCVKGKLRSLRDIKRHVADKHEISSPSGADWTKVEVILRTTPRPLTEAEGEDLHLD